MISGMFSQFCPLQVSQLAVPAVVAGSTVRRTSRRCCQKQEFQHFLQGMYPRFESCHFSLYIITKCRSLLPVDIPTPMWLKSIKYQGVLIVVPEQLQDCKVSHGSPGRMIVPFCGHQILASLTSRRPVCYWKRSVDLFGNLLTLLPSHHFRAKQQQDE